MQDVGKLLVLVGVVLAGAGLWFWSGRGFGWLGRLPGDIAVGSGNTRFYFPVTTCILLSIVLSLLSWLLRR